MNDELEAATRVLIEPEPTAHELVAILASMQPGQAESIDEPAAASHWASTARCEQLRTDLHAPWNGWNR